MAFGTSLPARIVESAGTVYYVDQAIGSDTYTATQAQNPATPWLTVQKALSTATTAGSIIKVRSGRYGETMTWSTVGTVGAPLTLVAYPGEYPVFAGRFSFTGSYLRVRGVRFEASGLTPDNKACISFGQGGTPCDHCEVDRCQVTHPKVARPTLQNTATTGGFLTGNQIYYYRVAAVTNEGTCIPGYEESLTTAAGTNTNVITVSWPAWTPPAGVTLTGYKIYRATTFGVELLLATVGVQTSYVDNTNATPSGAFLSQTSGIYWGDAPGPTSCHVYNTLVYECGTDRNLDHGLYVGYGSGHVVANCISHDNYCHGLKFAPKVSNSYFVNNSLIHNGYGPAASAPVVGSGIIWGSDPLYCDFTNFVRNNICKNNASYGFRDFWDVATITGNTHTSTVIDNMTNPNGAWAQGTTGALISGSGIQAGTKIVTVDSATQVTISLATTSTLVGTVLTIGGYSTFYNNCTHGNASGGIGVFTNAVSVQDTSVGNITTDPLLVDAANFNYALQAGSPAIGAGIDTYAPVTDYNGVTRVTADLGALAYIAGGAAGEGPPKHQHGHRH